MAVSVLVGWGVGYWLDSKFETGPWLMLAGTILGVSAGFKGLLQTAQKVNKRQIAETEAITSKSGDSKTSNELSNSVTLTTREVL